MKKIYSELSRIQQELKAPKNLYNNFGKYKYRNAEGILEAVKPILNGLSLIINDDLQYIGNRYYIKATATLTDGEESVSASAFAREDETKKGMDGCQITGACSSYARKYALNALLMIDDSKDSDDDSLSPKNPANREEEKFVNPPMTGGQVTSASMLPQDSQKVDVSIAKAFESNMNEFMQRFEIADSQEALRKFNEIRKTLQKSGAVPKGEKMKTVDEINNTFDAIYKNLKPGDAA